MVTTKLKPCPVCGGNPENAFEKRGYKIATCEFCTHTYIATFPPPDHVQSIYSDEYFNGGGEGYPNYQIGEELLIAHGRRYAQLLSRYMSPGCVLDVGAAAGFILRGLVEKGWQGEGIEPNANMARMAQEKFGLNVRIGALENANFDRQYDLITMIQVAAHFYDVARAFEIAAEITKPGGWWLVETSDKESLPARLFGRNWHFISPPSVQNWFSRDTFAALSNRFGMVPVASGRPEKWIKGAHAKSVMRYKLSGRFGGLTRPLLRLVPDKLPIRYPSLDLFWMLLRKQ
jgi:SAM-dependent methyltransferase